MLDLAPWQWALGALCAFMVGVAKTGVPGLGIMVVPLMVLVVGDAKLSNGVLLPMLCAADAFAVVYFRRHARWDHILRLYPGVLVGVGLGWLALYHVPDAIFRPMIGGIVLIMLAIQLLRKRQKDSEVSHKWAPAAVFGVTAGFATTASNAAGPVMNLYLLSMGLPKDAFMGTGAWYFFTINLLKVPIFAHQGVIDSSTLGFGAMVLPAIIIGAISGRKLFEKVPQKIFEVVVLILTTIAALLLFR
jgi:uncharacterized membrane protein YfcA